MNIPPPDAVYGPTEYWFHDTHNEAEKLAAALRAHYGPEKIVPPPQYVVGRDVFVVSATDVGDTGVQPGHRG